MGVDKLKSGQEKKHICTYNMFLIKNNVSYRNKELTV